MHRINYRAFAVSACLALLSPSVVSAALFNSPCVDELTGESNGCTANDIGVQDIKIVWVGDGCTGPTDTALVRMDVTLATANADRYDPGIFINTKGGTSAVTATGNQCLHEALYPVTTVTAALDYASGFGPYLDSDGDLTGDMLGGEVLSRQITQGDIGDANASTVAEFVISCADNDDGLGNGPNGYVDFAWSVSYGQQTNAIIGNSIIDTVPGAKSKCTSGTSDTAGTIGSIAVGVPNLGVQVVCSPTTLNVGETTTCTATYTNSSILVAADYVKFKINYPSSEGSVTGVITKSNAAESATDDTSGIVDWTMSGGQISGNIPPSTTNTITFDYTYTGGPDFNISIDTFYDNGSDPEVKQSLSDSVAFTTLPVTISYVKSAIEEGRLAVDFSTASETANVGFNLYAVDGKQWTKLNDQPYAGSLDSFEPVDYTVNLDLPAGLKVKQIGIAGIDKDGNEDRHGPYAVGTTNGAKPQLSKVAWGEINKALSKKSKAIGRAAAKKAFSFKTNALYLDVPQDGVYRVTHSDLMANGVDLRGRKTSAVAVTLKNKGVARHVYGDKGGRWTDESVIEFAGTAPRGADALYLDVNRYRIQLSKKKVVENGPIALPTTDTHTFETNSRYSYSLPQKDPFYDTYFYSRGNGSDGELVRHFDMPAMKEGTSTLTLNLSGYSNASHQLQVYLNGTNIGSESAEGWTDWTIAISVDNALFQEGDNTLTLTIPSRDGVFDYDVFDKFSITRELTEPYETKSPAIVINEKILKKQLKVGGSIDYVVVSHPLFMGEVLDDYIDAREKEGWKVKLVNIEEVYEAYGYGMATPQALKRYFNSFKNTNVTHIQLVGASNYDYHDYLGLGAVSFIPSMYAWTGQIIHYTPCDTCLVSDKDGMPKYAIGRWPVRSVEELSNIVDKTLTWETSGQCAARSALLIADKTDKGMSFGAQMDEMKSQLTSFGFEAITNVNLESLIAENNGSSEIAVGEARESIANAFAAGAALTSYSGHSSPALWSFSGLLKEADIAGFENEGKTTIALPLACFSTYADSPYTNTIAHQMSVAGKNAAVAIYGATMRSSYGDNGLASETMIDNMMRGQTLGEAVKNSKNALGIRYHDMIKNNNLIGDSTLKFCGE